MCDANKDATLSLKVMINIEKDKVLFAEADNDFVDVLLSFLTLPLGRIIKLLKNHFKDDEIPTIGSLNILYHSLENLDSAHFVTEAAKETLLNPTSSFEAEYERLKLDITDFQPAEYFRCSNSPLSHDRFRSVSIYYDDYFSCTVRKCHSAMHKEVAEKVPRAAVSGDGVFTINTASFVISDDLQIVPSVTGLFHIIGILGIADMMDKAEVIKVTIGLNEMLSLLKSSLTSPTPLSDFILNKTSANVESETKISTNQIETETKISTNQIETKKDSDSKISLKVAVQISSGKVLYAEAEQDFVEFLFSLLFIPLGGVNHLLSGEACFKAINNLHRSSAEIIDDMYFVTSDMKERLMKPNVVHGCVSDDHILPLSQQPLPSEYVYNLLSFQSNKFPEGPGRFLKGNSTYVVMNDLTVTPYRICTIISYLKQQNIPISDVKQVELQIGLKEALSILKASLTSTSALTDALLNHIPIKQPKKGV